MMRTIYRYIIYSVLFLSCQTPSLSLRYASPTSKTSSLSSARTTTTMFPKVLVASYWMTTTPVTRMRSCSPMGISRCEASVSDNNNNNNNNNNNKYSTILRGKMTAPSAQLELVAERMSLYFGSMVDPETNRFFLQSHPRCDSPPGSMTASSSVSTTQTQPGRSHQHCPLRDLGSAWDATAAVRVLGRQQQQQQQQQQLYSCCGNHSDAIASLRRAVSQTVDHYGSHLVDVDANANANANANVGSTTGDACKTLSPEILHETPTIAHNGLLLLALVESDRMLLPRSGCKTENTPDSDSAVEGLTRGILAMQRNDGAFRIRFEDRDTNSAAHSEQKDNDDDDDETVLRGIEFYPGEAMVALMEVFSHTSANQGVTDETRSRILPAMIRALGFYRSFYNQHRNSSLLEANYAIWQVQAFGRLALALPLALPLDLREDTGSATATAATPTAAAAAGITPSELATAASDYCADLCEDIASSHAWRMLSRGTPFYPNLSTVEIACGLDALVRGGLVEAARSSGNGDSNDDDNDSSIDRLARCIDRGIDFVAWSQDRVPAAATVGYGGLGHGGLVVTEQRLDVTGHALSAFSELV